MECRDRGYLVLECLCSCGVFSNHDCKVEEVDSCCGICDIPLENTKIVVIMDKFFPNCNRVTDPCEEYGIDESCMEENPFYMVMVSQD